MLNSVQHFFHDIALLFAFLWENMLASFRFFTQSIQAFNHIVRGFFNEAFASPPATDYLPIQSEVFGILNEIPAFGVLAGLIGAGIILLFFITAIKSFQWL